MGSGTPVGGDERDTGRAGVAGRTVRASDAVPNPVTALDSGVGAGVKTVAASDAAEVGMGLPHSGQNLDPSGTAARQEGQVTRGFYQRR